MPSPTDIVNAALDLCTESAIADLDGSDARSQKCKRLYQIWLGIEIEKEHWDFAIDRESIAADAVAPLNGWAYAYTLPADCLRPIRINNSDEIHFQVEGRKIVTDEPAPIILEYVSTEPDPNVWDATFTESFIHKMASIYAEALHNDAVMSEKLWMKHKDAQGEAIAKNGQTGTPPRPSVDLLTTRARRY